MSGYQQAAEATITGIYRFVLWGSQGEFQLNEQGEP